LQSKFGEGSICGADRFAFSTFSRRDFMQRTLITLAAGLVLVAGTAFAQSSGGAMSSSSSGSSMSSSSATATAAKPAAHKRHHKAAAKSSSSTSSSATSGAK
jgi:hypothetical protein